MEVRFLGHASIYLKTDQVSIVTDPWFSRSGAFLWSWFQFPDNTDLDRGFLRDVDYVVLSHEHQDHFDVPFLQTLAPSTKIVVPKYTDAYLLDTLRRQVRNEVIVAPALQPVQLGDVTLWPVVQSVPFWDDCTLVFDTPLGTIIDVNDMKVGAADLQWIQERFPNPYLFFIQFSGATYYPYCYEMPLARKVDIARNRIRSKFHGVKQLFETLGAQYLVPCAGPACFLDDEHFELNFSEASIFATQADFYRFAEEQGLAGRTIIPLPGEVLETGADPAAHSGRTLGHPAFTDRRGYLEAYRERRRDTIRAGLASLPGYEGSLVPAFQSFLEPLLRASAFFRRKINGAVLFDVTGATPEKILVDFRRVTGTCKPYEGEEFMYSFRLDGRLLALYLARELHFDQLLLSLRFSARRDPDVFNEHLFMFLRFADPASFEQIERYEEKLALDERFEMTYRGRRYEVQRYCPHALGDLSKGEVRDGYLVCPNHGWQFSLADGQARGQSQCIAINELAPGPDLTPAEQQRAR